MIFLVKLILAHFLGDFLLQPNTWVVDKEKKKIASVKLYLHIFIHVALLSLLFGDINLWLPILIIGLSHLLIDLGKLYLQKARTKRSWFFIDQGLHLLVIIAVFYFWKNPQLNVDASVGRTALIFITAVVFLSYPVSVLLKVVLVNFSKFIDDPEDHSLANAGTYIGILERILVLVFIVTDHWEAVGFLLAAKSIFRFGDLKESKDRKLTEYILIGTLLSFGIAIGTAILIKYLMAFPF